MARLLIAGMVLTPLSWDIYSVFLLWPCALMWRAGRRWSVLAVLALLYAQHQAPRMMDAGLPEKWMLFQFAAYLVALWRCPE